MSAKAPVRWRCQRAAPGGGAAATTLQKRTLWKSVISAVSWPSGPTSEEIKSGKWIASLPNPPCPHPSQIHLQLGLQFTQPSGGPQSRASPI